MLHTNGFSPKMSTFVENTIKRDFSQLRQYLPVCIRMCSSKELLSLHAFSQTPHMKFDTLVWVVMWALSVDFRPNVF